ncbi:MAG: copper-binding protein [Acidobacteriota bacterium]
MRAILATGTVVGVLLAGCASEKTPPAEEEVGLPGASAAASTYQGSGTITGIDIADKSVIIEHDAIPNFMSAMTMRFDVMDEKILQGLEEGMDMHFRIREEDDGYFIDQMEPGPRNRP